MGLFLASFSLRMGQFCNPVATHPRTNEVEVPPPPRVLCSMLSHIDNKAMWPHFELCIAGLTKTMHRGWFAALFYGYVGLNYTLKVINKWASLFTMYCGL